MIKALTAGCRMYCCHGVHQSVVSAIKRWGILQGRPRLLTNYAARTNARCWPNPGQREPRRSLIAADMRKARTDPATAVRIGATSMTASGVQLPTVSRGLRVQHHRWPTVGRLPDQPSRRHRIRDHISREHDPIAWALSTTVIATVER